MAELIPRLPPVALKGNKAPPIAGPVINLMRFFQDPIGVMLALKKSYGDVAALTENNASWIVAFGAAHNQQVLSDSAFFQNFAEIPIKVPADSAPVRLNNALTSMNGEQHKRHRRLMMPAFGKPAVIGYLDETVATADRVMARWQSGTTVDARKEMTELALCVAMQCLYGVDLIKEADELGELAVGFLDGLLSVGAMMFPVRIPGTPYARFLSTSERLEKRINRLIAERRSEAASKRDVLSLLIQAKDDDGTGLTDADLLGHAAVLFVAAHETTANTLTWTLMLLAQHPEVRRDLEDELDAALKGAAPSLEDLARLPLLDAVVKESMRLLPASAILFFRRAAGGFKLGDVELPKDSTVLLSSLVTHRDERVFPDANRFDPARWQSIKPSIYEYLPFGAGPRMCVGAPFAIQALRVMLAMMLQKHRFELVDGTRVDRQVRGITLGVKGALPMRVTRRTDAAVTNAPRLSGDIHALVTLPR